MKSNDAKKKLLSVINSIDKMSLAEINKKLVPILNMPELTWKTHWALGLLIYRKLADRGITLNPFRKIFAVCPSRKRNLKA